MLSYPRPTVGTTPIFLLPVVQRG